jgi:hypothetical protein
VTVSKATPTISTSTSGTVASGAPSFDQATVSGGSSPTGTVTFNLYNNPTPLFTNTDKPLVGGTAFSNGYTPSAPGTYYWVATYSGDSNNNSVTSGTASEPVTAR